MAKKLSLKKFHHLRSGEKEPKILLIKHCLLFSPETSLRLCKVSELM